MFGGALLTKLAITAGGIAAVIAAFWFWGHVQYNNGQEDLKADIASQVDKTKHESEKATTKIVTKYVDRIKVVHEKGGTIIKKVPVYVTKKDDARCVINTGFVQLWNDANKMQFSDTAAAVNETASAVKLSDVGTQHAKEARLYHETAEQLTAFQNWVEQQQKIYAGADNGG